MLASRSASRLHRRLSLLCGGSLAVGLFVGVGVGGGVLLTPTMALAANECAPVAPTLATPGDNGATADTYLCAGSYSAIGYTTSGNLTLQLQNNVTTSTGGLVVVGANADSVTISRLADSPANSGDPSLTSTSGAGLQVTRATAGGNISVSLSESTADTADSPLVVTGVAAGVRLSNMGTSTTSFTSSNGAITASAGAGIEIGTAGTGSLTVTNGSTVTGTTAAVLVTGGNAATINNNTAGVLNGVLIMNNSGSSSVNNAGRWNFSGSSLLGSGTSTVTNSINGRILAGADSALNFDAGTDTFTNTGRLAAEGTFTFLGLETWNNTGTVIFGGDEELNGSDGQANDRIVFAGNFNATGLSRLLMDVDFSADQVGCAAATTSDCFDLSGATVTGVTTIAVNAATRGAAERVVLVDVGGGTSSAGQFVLDGQVDGGMFLYALDYDAATQEHALVATDVSNGALELALLGRAASEPWRTATGMWHDRQADLRNALIGAAQGYAPGGWLKIAGGFVDETRVDANEAGELFNTSYSQRTTGFVGGLDLLRIIGDNSAWVLGVTAGKIDSRLEHELDASVLDMDGHSFGAYASILSGSMFFDAIVNATDLDLVHAAFGEEFEGAATSAGYQLEGGYRLFRFNDDGAWFEPLAALTYVRTKVDDLDIGQVTATFEDASSLRAALGARAGGDLVMDGLTASFSFTGRLWKEFDGDNTGSIIGATTNFGLADEGMDSLADLGVAVSLFTLGNRLSAHLAYNVLFNDDYQNTGASLGLRYNW